MQLAETLQCIYALTAAAILAINSLSVLRSRFISYGSRALDASSSKPSHEPAAKLFSHDGKHHPATGMLYQLLDLTSSITVSHAWFTHFYIVSVVSSIFWATQYLFNGKILYSLTARDPISSPKLGRGMTQEQVHLTWALMLAQGLRRLYECVKFHRSSSARMWVGHWVLGIGFYVLTGMAVWAEGIPSLQSSNPTWTIALIKAPSPRTFMFLPVFILASGIQHDCHEYLASLEKYTLPDHPMFRVVVCPHYFAECLIYLSLAVIAGPPGTLCNRTILSSLGFVAVNLGVTAGNTREWYERKFGRDKVAGRWAMVPFLY